MNSRLRRHIIMAALILSASGLTNEVSGQGSWFAAAGSGGYTGSIRFGAGFSPTHALIPELSLWYGYASKFENDIHALEARAIWLYRPASLRGFRIETGTSLAWYHTKNVFTTLPPQYPKGYYKPTSFQGLLHVGGGWEKTWQGPEYGHRAGVSLSLVCPMGQAWYATINRVPTLQDITTLSLNFRYYVPTKAVPGS